MQVREGQGNRLLMGSAIQPVARKGLPAGTGVTKLTGGQHEPQIPINDSRQTRRGADHQIENHWGNDGGNLYLCGKNYPWGNWKG